MKCLLLIAILFSINALADTIYLPQNKNNDWRDNLEIHFQEDSEYSTARILGTVYEVRSQSHFMTILLKLQAKEISATTLGHYQNRVTDIQLTAN